MNYLLWTDPHFTDNPIDAYRWDIFRHLKEISLRERVTKIVCLGDLVDRKDRHTAVLVNKLIDSFSDLHFDTGADVDILAGNHDMPLTGPYFWKFLNTLPGVRYLQKWEIDEVSVAYLPFSANPKQEWPDLSKVRAIFMHQTVEGAKIDGTYTIPKGHDLPVLPAIPIFSGDVHNPQFIKGITYIGCCHPIKFNESWNNRVIVIHDGDFVNFKEIRIAGTKRAILDITSSDELKKLTSFAKGDQLRIRYTLDPAKMTTWPVEEEAIKSWAASNGIFLASIEASLTGNTLVSESQEQRNELEVMLPEQVIDVFGKTENLSPEVIQMGLQLLKESK